MKELKIIVGGIGFNLFGIACMELLRCTNYANLLLPGVLFPIIGIIMIIYGLSKGNENSTGESEDNH